MKKVMILYASIGGGHYKAAEAIKNYIVENYTDYSAQMLDTLKYTNKLFDQIVINSYFNMAKYSPKMWGELYKFSEKQYTVANFSNMVQKLLSQKLYKLFKDENPAIVVSTHPFITEMVASLKKHNKTNCKLCVVITDYVSHKLWELKPEYIDKYFVANEEIKYGLIHNGISSEKIFVTGIPVAPAFLKEYSKKDILNEFDLSEDKKTFLLFGGGEYGLTNIKSIFKSILSLNEQIQIIAIAGKNLKTKKMFEKYAKSSQKRVIILGYTTRIPELMSIADFVISKPGGLTTTEILTKHVPFIIANPIPGQEEGNAQFLLNNGAAVQIFDSEKCIPMLKKLISDDVRLEHMKAMQEYLSKPNSTKNIVEEILK